MVPDAGELTKTRRLEAIQNLEELAAVSTSRCTISKSAAPEKCSVKARAETCGKWASICTRRC